MTRLARCVGCTYLVLAIFSVAGCGQPAALSMEDALAIADAEHEAESPVGDELFEQAVLVELVTLPGSDEPVFKVHVVTKLDGAAEPTRRQYVIDAEDGTIVDAPQARRLSAYQSSRTSE